MTAAIRLDLARALVVAGIVLYVPANILPVMTITVTGDVEPLTVLGGVQELYDSGLWPVAAVVCLASLVVPFMKLACLSWILLLHGTPHLRPQRTAVLSHPPPDRHVVDDRRLPPRHSRRGRPARHPCQRPARAGAIFFAAVLLCTLFAAEFYKPALIWNPDGDPQTAQ